MLTRLESPGITPLHSLDQNVDTKAIVKALPQDPEIKKRASAQLQLALSEGFTVTAHLPFRTGPRCICARQQEYPTGIHQPASSAGQNWADPRTVL
ncbi:hypothetical protein PAL_GLEAN10020681 [Pteropus alecto]|uniref:Uncharacterized protein n=1 Tax=Pteropus alecto TaxID=9402 RepID=L5JQ59_PTEAL|nr:hypothetical protein PAL_GLEAN10020681 [Pteropus alecto]